MNARRLLVAVLGAGFYRYWHVPAPHAPVSVRDGRRADLSVIGPGALGLLAAGAWTAGRFGTALLRDERVMLPVHTLPWTSRLLVLTGVLAVAVAAAWWLATAPVRARLARCVDDGSAVRVPDDPPEGREALHAAVTQLGRALRETGARSGVGPAAFAVLREAAGALTDDAGEAEQRRLRRRCLTMARRLRGGADPAPEPTPA